MAVHMHSIIGFTAKLNLREIKSHLIFLGTPWNIPQGLLGLPGPLREQLAYR